MTDAIQRSEYFSQAKDDWHTLLAPCVKTGRTMVLNRGTYLFALNADGTCCRFVLVDIDTFVNALFPATATDTTTPVGAAENAGDITTKDMSTFLFPNTYLYFGSPTTAASSASTATISSRPTEATSSAEKRYVLNYSSWISPGLFGGGVRGHHGAEP